MNIKKNFPLLSLIAAIVLTATSQTTKANSCDDCNASFQSCLQGCSLIRVGVGCQIACENLDYTCLYANCPHQYALRNGSVYTMNFFRSNGSKIDSLSGWSPHALDVEESDFPITASYCSAKDYHSTDPKKAYCKTDDHFSYTIKEKGCYVLWYAGGYYTTDDACYLKGEEASSSKNKEMVRPPFPSTPPSRSEETNPPRKKETAPLTPPSATVKGASKENSQPEKEVVPAPPKPSPTVKEVPKDNSQPEKEVIPSTSKPSATVKEALKENPQPRKELVPPTSTSSPESKEVPSHERQPK